MLGRSSLIYFLFFFCCSIFCFAFLFSFSDVVNGVVVKLFSRIRAERLMVFVCILEFHALITGQEFPKSWLFFFMRAD